MSPVLELRSVSKSFTQGDETIVALHPSDLSIEAGEFVGILGPSGSGKSTLLTIMGGLRTPSSGEVLIDGRSLCALPEKKRAAMRLKSMGFILQAAGLVPFLNVRDQLTQYDVVAGRKGDPERRDALLDALGVAGHAEKFPDELSGGERQRVAIASALYHDPALVLADEPTAALDSHRAMSVAKLLAGLTREQGKACVMVTHDERLLEVCDRVLRMRDGVLSEKC